jgi:hypothetical protein
MRKYLMLLLISIFSLGLLSCSRSKDKSMTNADKESISSHPDPTDEKGWSFEGEQKPSKEKSNTSDKKAEQ